MASNLNIISSKVDTDRRHRWECIGRDMDHTMDMDIKEAVLPAADHQGEMDLREMEAASQEEGAEHREEVDTLEVEVRVHQAVSMAAAGLGHLLDTTEAAAAEAAEVDHHRRQRQ